MTHASPQLIVTAGPARGRSIPLEGSVSIGRDEQNALPISDPALSRHHCVIDRAGRRVRDPRSRQQERRLRQRLSGQRAHAGDGDQIRIGDSALVVMLPGDGADPDRPSVALVDTPMPAASTVAIDARSSRYLLAAESAARGSRAAQDLRALLRFSEALQSVRSADALFDLVLTTRWMRFARTRRRSWS